tara:strand:+ start:347 stop:1066 length:720 start_codon:yes stop_codon:yes gene_type:complete
MASRANGSSASEYGEVPAGCWTTAAIDPEADLKGVNLVFGYGSLCWKPPCAEEHIVRAFPAKVKGFLRRFWQFSHDHRGTPDSPGFVVVLLRSDHPDINHASSKGLVQDGEIEECVGMCYEIRNVEEVLGPLHFREKNGYTATVTTVYSAEHAKEEGKAIVYFTLPGNDPTYSGPLQESLIAERIAKSIGPSGRNDEYLFNLSQWLQDNNIRDHHIESLAELVRALQREGEKVEEEVEK